MEFPSFVAKELHSLSERLIAEYSRQARPLAVGGASPAEGEPVGRAVSFAGDLDGMSRPSSCASSSPVESIALEGTPASNSRREKARCPARVSINEVEPESDPSVSSDAHSDGGSSHGQPRGEGAATADSIVQFEESSSDSESAVSAASDDREWRNLPRKRPRDSLLLVPRRGTPREDECDFELLHVWVEARRAAMVGRRNQLPRSRVASPFSSFVVTNAKQDACERIWGLLSRFIIHPGSMTHIVSDLCGYLLIAYDCVAVPLELFDPPVPRLLAVTMPWVIRVFWSLHMAKSALTGYYRTQGTVEMRAPRVVGHYAKTFLALDALAVGVSWLAVAGGGFRGWDRAARMCRVVRLVHMGRAQGLIDFVIENIRSERVLLIASIARIMVMMWWVAHVLACSWYGLGRHGPQGATWVAESAMEGRSFWFRYVTSFHWSLLTFSGATNIEPRNTAELTFSAVAVFIAFFISASIVSSMTSAMTRLQILSSNESKQVSALRRYMTDHQISQDLAMRVQSNAQHALGERTRNAPEGSIELLKLISEPLRVELHYEIYSASLFTHPFFWCFSQVFPSGIRKVCHTAVSLLSLSSGDTLFSDLEAPVCPRVFYVLKGGLTYAQEGKGPLAVGVGQWLCEHALWTAWRHVGTLQARAESQLLILDAARVQEICSSYPTGHACCFADQFVSWLNLARLVGLSDVVEWDEDLNEALAIAFPECVEVSDADDAEVMSREDTMGHESSNGSDRSAPSFADGFSGGSSRPHVNAMRSQRSMRSVRFKGRASARTPGAAWLPGRLSHAWRSCLRCAGRAGRRLRGEPADPVVPYAMRKSTRRGATPLEYQQQQPLGILPGGPGLSGSGSIGSVASTLGPATVVKFEMDAA